MTLTRENPEKTCPSANLSTTNPTWTDMGANQGLCGERWLTNYLSHCTTFRTMVRHGLFIIYDLYTMSSSTSGQGVSAVACTVAYGWRARCTVAWRETGFSNSETRQRPLPR
jgi:hypothetical protein